MEVSQMQNMTGYNFGHIPPTNGSQDWLVAASSPADDTSNTDDYVFRAFTLIDITDYTIQLVLAMLIMTVNGFVMYTLASTPSLYNVSYFIIGSLALADFGMGLARPLESLLDIGVLKGKKICLLSHCFSVGLSSVSMQHLIFVSIDRFIRIKYPFRYKDIMSKRKTVAIIAMFWISSFVFSYMPMMGILRDDFNGSVCSAEYFMKPWYLFLLISITYIITSLLLGVIYFKIFLIARRKKALCARKGIKHGYMSYTMKSLKAAKLLAVLCLYFLLSWLPFSCLRFLTVIRGHTFPVPVIVERISLMVAIGNSLGNPLLYAFGERNVRAAMKKILTSRIRVTRSAEIPRNHTESCL